MAAVVVFLLEKALHKLLKVEYDDQVDIIPQDEGLLIKYVDAKSAAKCKGPLKVCVNESEEASRV